MAKVKPAPSPALAFYQPDIPQNLGAAMRLCACLDVPMHVIEPTAFPWKEAEFRRAGMDYVTHVDLRRHSSWTTFLAARGDARVILVETDGAVDLWDFAFRPGDILLLGRESAGVPREVYERVDASIRIPMKPGLRSMNVVTAAALGIGEALRQTRNIL
ncbi:MAG: tRNA (cytidine(34)-2'-O)-methyltransferase [Rhodospirillales bacterium]|nr:tRNA (cytidine(34)-2'-O)-methyltransferase [Alphaproteobacteria bacterium]MCB9987640.1 tRNA (cytidine(34)-2'-O)-methyltransferase [Rhodospirillales bacterium]USO08061.1 MAG: tRNA (cytidine(34)-2'-O)-methyltransferase [Rhodospirillales bacterium]